MAREGGAHASTDADGRFELERVPRHGITLVSGGGQDVELETVADPLDVVVVKPWLGHVQVTVAGEVPQGASLELHDAADQAVVLTVFGGGNTWRSTSLALDDVMRTASGRTPVLSVPDTARAAVLLDARRNVIRSVPVVVGEGIAGVTL